MQAQPQAILAALAANLDGLISSGVTTQTQVALDVKEDQGFISHAQHGRLKRVTPRVRKLISYVDMRISGHAVPGPVLEAAKAYMAGGGNPDLLAQSIRLLSAVRST